MACGACRNIETRIYTANLEQNLEKRGFAEHEQHVRPAIIQSSPSVENGLFRRPNRAFSYSIEKRAYSPQTFLTRFDLHIRLRTSTFSTGYVSRIAQSFHTFKTHRIAHPTTKARTRPHTHTRHHAVSYNSVDAALLAVVTAAGSCRKSAWHIPSPNRQQCASSDGSSVPYR